LPQNTPLPIRGSAYFRRQLMRVRARAQQASVFRRFDYAALAPPRLLTIDAEPDSACCRRCFFDTSAAAISPAADASGCASTRLQRY